MTDVGRSLQETYAPSHVCFGCGPANAKGLRIRSFADGDDETHAEWIPEPHHSAFPGILAGGVIGSLLDCHSNWTAAWHLMRKAGAAEPPCTVTADYAVSLKRPCPMETVTITAKVVESAADRAIVESTLVGSNGKICATCRGTFVAVKEGHPAFNRW